MKKLYTVIARTKAEYGGGGPPAISAPASYTTLQAAKTGARSLINAATVSYVEIYGPSGFLSKMINPAGA
jgi:hypothetical protein